MTVLLETSLFVGELFYVIHKSEPLEYVLLFYSNAFVFPNPSEKLLSLCNDSFLQDGISASSLLLTMDRLCSSTTSGF